MACVGVHVSRRLKEELAWATDKRLQVISNIIPLYRHLVSSKHDALSPSIPNIDFNQTGAEDLCVPGSANHTTSLMSSELNAPRLGILELIRHCLHMS